MTESRRQPAPTPSPPPDRRRDRWQFGLIHLLGILTLAAFVAGLYAHWLRKSPLLTLAVIAGSLLAGLLPHLLGRLVDHVLDRRREPPDGPDKPTTPGG